ncbi:MAG: hypothetical protein N2439_03285, partial [Anaerolineae bacterium]|nr:hypothetical protein [Anaerolineae bacterium]
TNRITVTAPLFDPDGSGPLPAVASQPAQGATARVRIYRPTGLTVADFQATAAGGQVMLAWRTANEAQILGFNILRRTGNGPWQTLNEEILVAEHAGSNQGTAYSYTDRPLPGEYTYALEVIQLDGSRTSGNAVTVRVSP